MNFAGLSGPRGPRRREWHYIDTLEERLIVMGSEVGSW